MEPWHQNEAFRSMEPAKQKMIEQLAVSPAGKKINRGTSSADAVETDDAAGKYSVYGGRKSDIDRNLFCAALTAAEKTI